MSAHGAAQAAHIAENTGKITATGGGTAINGRPVGQINVGVPVYTSPDKSTTIGVGVSQTGQLDRVTGPWNNHAAGASITWRF